MLVFARFRLAGPDILAEQPALLLEGHWPAEAARPNRWSLDEAIDHREGWIDRWAADQAEALGRPEPESIFNASAGAAEGQPTFAYLNALALRYYLVRLLRVVAYFDRHAAGHADAVIEFHGERKRDQDYADLLKQIAAARGTELELCWHEPAQRSIVSRHRERPWRRWAAQADDFLQSAAPPSGAEHRVVLCGNPHVLDPVCQALLDRGCQVWWLYERFAVRSWWKWRRLGVRQLVCDRDVGRAERFNDGGAAGPLIVREIDLGPAVEHWLARLAAQAGDRQSRLVARIDEHFRAIEPTALVVDEDATAFKRAAVALARHHRARSIVVQHGAPCGPFGFAPLAADHFCAWGPSTREQLLHWGLPPERVHETGWPRFDAHLQDWQAIVSQRRRVNSPRILLLATTPPRDARPDTAAFHLTQHTHEQMLVSAFSAAARLPDATVTVKLHPRCRDAAAFRQVAARFPQLRIRFVHGGELPRLVAASDCILSCASTSGIEAALMGAPVVQLLPAGSDDVLPADRWGFIGTARDEQELDHLVGAALARGWQAPVHVDQVLGNPCRAAADKVADVVLHAELTGAAPASDRRTGGSGL